MDSPKKLAHTDLDWAIGINRRSLKILGLWPDDKLNRRQKILADFRATVIFLLMSGASVVPSLIALVKVRGDMMAMTDNIQLGLPFSVTVMKFVIMWYRRKDLEPIVNMVIKDWLKTKTEWERVTMLKQARMARMIVMFGGSMMVFATFILIIPPCFGYTTRYLTNLTEPDGARPLLVQTYFFRDMTVTPYYEIVVTAQASSIIVAAISYTGVDTFLGLLVFHICAQLEILKERLLNLNSFKDFNAAIAFNIEEHLRLIRSVDIIDSTFNLMLLALLVYFAMLFCLQGFLIVNIINGRFGDVPFLRICWFISILINIFAHMCLYCVVGEILIAKGEDIFHAAYNYTWYMRAPNEAKSLMMILIRAEKPLYITAGGMFPMTLSMFCNVIKTSAGYISVLLANL